MEGGFFMGAIVREALNRVERALTISEIYRGGGMGELMGMGIIYHLIP